MCLTNDHLQRPPQLWSEPNAQSGSSRSWGDGSVEHLPVLSSYFSTHGEKQGVAARAYNPSTREWRQEDSKSSLVSWSAYSKKCKTLSQGNKRGSGSVGPPASSVASARVQMGVHNYTHAWMYPTYPSTHSSFSSRCCAVCWDKNRTTKLTSK